MGWLELVPAVLLAQAAPGDDLEARARSAVALPGAVPVPDREAFLADFELYRSRVAEHGRRTLADLDRRAGTLFLLTSRSGARGWTPKVAGDRIRLEAAEVAFVFLNEPESYAAGRPAHDLTPEAGSRWLRLASRSVLVEGPRAGTDPGLGPLVEVDWLVRLEGVQRVYLPHSPAQAVRHLTVLEASLVAARVRDASGVRLSWTPPSPGTASPRP